MEERQSTLKRRPNLRKIGVIAVIVLVAVALYFVLGRSSVEAPETTYITVPVEKGTLKAEINSTGTVKARVEVQVGAQVSGTIKKLYADFESVVKEGDLIALIDPDTYKAKVGQAKANLLAAKARLAKSEVALVDQTRTLRRKEELVKTHAISQQEYDTAETNVDAARAQIDADKATVAQTGGHSAGSRTQPQVHADRRSGQRGCDGKKYGYRPDGHSKLSDSGALSDS